VRYSFTLFELTPDGSRVRVQTDSTDQPFDINEGSKLELGSTAKMRVLTTYLQIIAELHDKYAGMSMPELKKVDVPEQDRLSRWVVDYLIQNKDRSLRKCSVRRWTANTPPAPARRFSPVAACTCSITSARKTTAACRPCAMPCASRSTCRSSA
jgi:hypothetical protein